MQELNLKLGPFTAIRKGIGILNLICASGWLLSRIDSLRFFDFIFFAVFLISGLSLLTNGFGTERSYIHPGESHLKIKWLNWFRSAIVRDDEIKQITLTRFRVTIYRKDNKQLKLAIDYLERDQKKEVYDFFIEYAKNKNLELIRDF
jgi:hypothetical protein